MSDPAIPGNPWFDVVSCVGPPKKVTAPMRDTEPVEGCQCIAPGDERDDSVIGIGADRSYHRAFDYSRNQSPPVHAGGFCFIFFNQTRLS
jgi:hypothetical protein